MASRTSANSPLARFSYVSTTLQDLQGPDPRPAALLDALHGAVGRA